MEDKQDRDYVQIKDRVILHSTARHDWVCGICGGPLTTQFFEDVPNWRTVCTSDPAHDQDTFVHGSTYAYLEAHREAESITAEEVFANLPAELQAAIKAAS